MTSLNLERQLTELLKSFGKNNKPTFNSFPEYMLIHDRRINSNRKSPKVGFINICPSLDLTEKQYKYYINVLKAMTERVEFDHLSEKDIILKVDKLVFDYRYPLDKRIPEIKNIVSDFISDTKKKLITAYAYYPLPRFDTSFKFDFLPYKIIHDFHPKILNSSRFHKDTVLEIKIMANNFDMLNIKAAERFNEFIPLIYLVHKSSTFDRINPIDYPSEILLIMEDKYIIHRNNLKLENYSIRNQDFFVKNSIKYKNLFEKDPDDRTELDKRFFKALNWYNKIINSSEDSLKIMYCVIGLEALFLEGRDKKAISLQILISLMYIEFLPDRMPSNIFNEIKKYYKIRSSIAHGSENINFLESTRKTDSLFPVSSYKSSNVDHFFKTMLDMYVDFQNSNPKFTKIKDLKNVLKRKENIRELGEYAKRYEKSLSDSEFKKEINKLFSQLEKNEQIIGLKMT